MQHRNSIFQTIWRARRWWAGALVLGVMAYATISSRAGGHAQPTTSVRNQDKASFPHLLRPRPASASRPWTPVQTEVIEAFSFQQKLTANDGAEVDVFGIAVAVSGDTAVVGAAGDDIGAANEQGSAYVYTRNGATWTQRTKLTANDGTAGDGFGVSVAIDGNTILVGSYADDIGAVIDQGSAYVFTGSGATWTEQAKLIGTSTAAQILFGFSVAVQGDTALIGVPLGDGNGALEAGAAFVFTRSGTNWTQQQELNASDGDDGDNLGVSVSLDGNTAAIGALNDDVGNNGNQGSAYIFTRNGATWTQQAKLTANDGAAGDLFGVSVGVSGNTVIAGSIFDDIGPSLLQGSAYIFLRTGTAWAQQQKLVALDGMTDDRFGGAVAISGDTVAIGAPDRNNGANVGQGAVYSFTRTAGVWNQDPPIIATDGAAGDAFGGYVALQNTTLAIGAQFDTIGANADQGSAYIYNVSGPQFSISDVTVTEGNSGFANANFTLTLSQQVLPNASVTISTSDGTAIAGSDYTATTVTITFIGITSTTVSIPVRGDTQFEPDETFFVNLSNPTGGVGLGDSQGQGTILNDDTPPTVRINDTSVNEGNTGTTPADFTVMLSNASAAPVVITYNTSDGTAEAGTDYQNVRSATATINPGQLTATIPINVIGDTMTEPDETFFVNLVDTQGLTITDGQGQGTIINDDGGVGATLQFSAATYTANEISLSSTPRVVLTVNRIGDASGTTTVDYKTDDNFAFVDCAVTSATAHQRCDYLSTSGRLTFAPGEASKTIVVPIVDDFYVEPAPAETFTVSLSNPSSGGVLGTPATATVNLNSDDSVALAERTFVVRLLGSQAVPPATSTATASGRLTLNAAENTLTVNTLIVPTFNSPQFGATINGPAQVGVNGPLLTFLPNGNVFDASVGVSPATVAQLRKGLFYINITTANFPEGEIRGQILSNPLESARFFVRQQYFDFLNREPDAGGFDFWTNEIVGVCGVDLNCIHRRRRDVSAAFFIEQEFQETGAFVFRTYKAAFGEQTLYRPTYADFVPDRARVVGGVDLAAGKLAFANDFVTRAAFTARYPTTQTPTQLVDAILTTVQQGAGVTYTAAERAAFINTVTNNGRGAFIRDLADNLAFRNAVFNRAFVLTQYFGYLHRDPDQAGYDFWLGVLNSQPNNFSGMVCAFSTSDEYQKRFSPVSPRTNNDCQTIP